MSLHKLEYKNLTKKPTNPFNNIINNKNLKKFEKMVLQNSNIQHLLNNNYKMDISDTDTSNSSLSDYVQSSEYSSSNSSSNSSIEDVNSVRSDSSEHSYKQDSQTDVSSDTDYEGDDDSDSDSDSETEDIILMYEEFKKANNEWINAIKNEDTRIENAKIWCEKWQVLITKEPHPFTPNFYEILDLDDNCTYKQLKKNWCKLREQTRVKEDSSKTFLQIQEAYRVLSDDELRYFYDIMLMVHRGNIIIDSEYSDDEVNSDIDLDC